MSYTKPQICNLALGHFGQGKINSLDDTSENARQLNLNYDPCLESTLRAFPWNFATKVQALALSTETFPGWTYVYSYPANCVKVRAVYNENGARATDEEDHYKIFTNGSAVFIACDIEDAYVEYTYKVVDPTLYDALFVKAFSYMLASEIASALANSAKGAEMFQKYQIAINEAQFAGAVENNDPPAWPTSYIKGRR